jgi:MFS family permease
MPLIPRTAIYFVILLGCVSFFADMTYEGAKSISGQYLSLLGASAFAVATISGFGELVGYAFRFISGYISDRTRMYWGITILGYGVNVLAVPLLALTSQWESAAVLMILERCGKAIRTPARDAMLSYATKEMGRGWGFGLHTAMDRMGSILGPLAVTFIFVSTHSYQLSFALLVVPAVFAMSLLLGAQSLFPHPQELEIKNVELQPKGLSRTFWIYVFAVSLVAAGYVDFPLIAYHFQKDSFPEAWIPLYYAAAMGMGAVSALLCGRYFDKYGLPVLMIATAISAFFAPLVFLGNVGFSFIGILIWGAGLGVQGSIMRAVVANLVSYDKRGTGYGILNASFGIAWFVGSVIIGLLYSTSLTALILFSVITQLLAIPLLLLIKKQ